MRDEKVKVLKAIPPIAPANLVRGQFHGYLDEKGVAPNSQIETFAALRWRSILALGWRSLLHPCRKNLPVTCMEVMARPRKPPNTNMTESDSPQNYMRFRISPEITIAMTVSVTTPTERKPASVELIASRHPRPDEMEAYERVLGDAMAGTRHCSLARTTSKRPGESSTPCSKHPLPSTSTSRHMGAEKSNKPSYLPADGISR